MRRKPHHTDNLSPEEALQLIAGHLQKTRTALDRAEQEQFDADRTAFLRMEFQFRLIDGPTYDARAAELHAKEVAGAASEEEKRELENILLAILKEAEDFVDAEIAANSARWQGWHNDDAPANEDTEK